MDSPKIKKDAIACNPCGDCLCQRVAHTRMNVRLFRRNNKHSFSVQLSPSSGIVEVHCSSPSSSGVTVADNALSQNSLEELEDHLLRLGRTEFGHLGGFHEPYGFGWKVQLVELGMYNLKARGFVQCTLIFEKMQQLSEVHSGGTAAAPPSPAALPRSTVRQKKAGLQWLQQRK